MTDNLAIFQREKSLRVARSLPAHADHTEVDSVVG
jgi:hypothetical protein